MHTPADLVPSATAVPRIRLRIEDAATLAEHAVVAVPVAASGDPGAGVSRETLTRWGFGGKPGTTMLLPRDDGATVLVGIGDAATAADLRDAAATAARVTSRDAVVATTLANVPGPDPQTAAQAVVEGIVLGRYRYDLLRSDAGAPSPAAVEEIVLLVDADRMEAVRLGAAEGLVQARVAAVSRDLANAPGSLLSAPAFADVAEHLATGDTRLEVTSYDLAQLTQMGCGGLLGVNAGSTTEPRMIKVSYTPVGEPTGHLGLVGKGITYDSGGISLKPTNAMHVAMKMDMTGAGAILAAMSGFAELQVGARVTAYLACTDNMPSGSATKLGDVLTTRSGRTIEVVNTDAEGRLVMADAIDLVREEKVDAIVDIATLTGAALLALGPLTGVVIGNDAPLIDLVRESAATTDERLWQLPLDTRYRPWLDSSIADIKNLGGESAGSIIAALFLSDWVGSTPWAHLDIAGPMKSDKDDAWRTTGATGFGARLLLDAASRFSRP